MLQDLRQKTKGTTAKIVVGVIVLSFSIFGIESILLGGSGSGIAEVNGEEVTPQELQQSVNTQKRRLISMMGENIDPAMLDDQRLSAQALEGLINRKLLMQSASAMKLAVSERQIGAVVATMEQFQVDGKFSPEVYKSVLSSAGYTPAYFKQSLSQDMLLNHLRSGLAGSEFATPSELTLNAQVLAEQRDVRYLTIPLEKYTTSTEIEEAEIEAFYQANQAQFRTDEAVDVDFIELLAEDFRQPVEESAILEAYELAKQNAQYQTANRVSHILFETGEGSGEDLQQRIASAQSKLNEGVDFADVARELSDDIGSAGNGGDLGFSSGDAFPEEMESAIATLEVGVVSQPVQTDAGTHLILVTERNAGEEASLEDMRAELQESIQIEESRVVLLRTVESLRDLSFNADDLQTPAEELQLSVQQAENISRSQAEGMFANPALLAAAFSDEVLASGHNSEVIEIAGDRFVVLRVRKHHESEVKPLESVREDIVAAITESAAREAVASEAERAVQQLRSGVSVEQFAVGEGYDWQVELGADRRNTAVPRGLLQRVFNMAIPAEGEVATDFIMTPTGDAQVFELTRVTPGQFLALEEPEQRALQQQVSAEFANLLDTEFQRGLRDNADITVF